MSKSTQLRCQIPTPLYNRLQAQADEDGLTIRQVLLSMIIRDLDVVEAKTMLFNELENNHE